MYTNRAYSERNIKQYRVETVSYFPALHFLCSIFLSRILVAPMYRCIDVLLVILM